MKAVIQAIIGILIIVVAGREFTQLYKVVKLETVHKVHKGLSPLVPFTQRLTGQSKY